ncbi:MAG: DUF4286 family protein [Betaproteobacteria bacterium]|nr:DUF4286 family protein [Betaproteobacteria bacterium]
MSVVLFTVKATIPKEKEDAFNRWYNEVHCPHLLRYAGAVSARRYRTIMGDDKYQYMALYEFQDEATFQRFMKSDHLAELRDDYNAVYADSERQIAAYAQIWP